MTYLFYVRLIGLTAGTLTYLFLLALILGHRRPRLFERLLFLLSLAIFLIYSGELLEINARIQYASVSDATRLIYGNLISAGTIFLLPLVWHTHFEYRRSIARGHVGRSVWGFVCLLYVTTLFPLIYAFLDSRKTGASFLEALSRQPSTDSAIWSACAVSAAILQFGLARREKM